MMILLKLNQMVESNVFWKGKNMLVSDIALRYLYPKQVTICKPRYK